MDLSENIRKAASVIRSGSPALVFTGAGISVESGIPPFRGQGGLWDQVDPGFIEINRFLRSPDRSWPLIKQIFYDSWGAANPNPAHLAVAEMERMGLVKLLVTQNIDCLHQRAGSKDVVEFHGTLERLVCRKCTFRGAASPELLAPEVPHCPVCSGLLKPDFVFFGEAIPETASERSFSAANEADTVIVIGTSGEVMPACLIVREAKRAGAKIIEVNIDDSSSYCRDGVTDILLAGQAGNVMTMLLEELKK